MHQRINRQRKLISGKQPCAGVHCGFDSHRCLVVMRMVTILITETFGLPLEKSWFGRHTYRGGSYSALAVDNVVG